MALLREPMVVEAVTLAGQHVRLEPLSPAHFDDLLSIGLDPDLWRWTPTQIHTPAELRHYLETARREQAEGRSLPFATISLKDGRAVGSTRYANLDREHRRVEIGWTWVGREWQRTPVNTEAKYLLLRHAFDTLGCIRVELKTDSLNERSRRAILRVGAREEGTLRNHMITASGRVRHTVYFSIIEAEWPEVKAGLEAKLAHPFPPPASA